MILKKVKIYNYRQLQKVELDLQNSLTVLAGPNNSGKTTLISVLKGMFRDKKLMILMVCSLPRHPGRMRCLLRYLPVRARKTIPPPRRNDL